MSDSLEKKMYYVEPHLTKGLEITSVRICLSVRSH